MGGAADILVAGAGAIGAAITLALARTGRRVVRVDPIPAEARTSGVAAGMLAPAFETLFDTATEGRYGTLAAARDLWPSLADALDLPLDRGGAVAVGSPGEAAAWAERLTAMGARAEFQDAAAVAGLAPGVAPGLAGVFSPDDWRLEPLEALQKLETAALRVGAETRIGRVRTFERGRVVLEDGSQIATGRLVIATGAERSLATLAPELLWLEPIKGHILRAPGSGATHGPVVRGAHVYLCPAGRELILGASMEPGRDDTVVDETIVADLKRRADRILPGVAGRAWRPAVGVRAGTPDGLPLVGPGAAPNVILAVGARRNGWLLAPMIATIVADLVDGRHASPEARGFDPSRRLVSPPN